MEKPTKPQTSSSARADAKKPAEVVIEFEPMVSRDPIIWNRRRYDYVFKVAHTNSNKGGWHIYCCDAQIPWVQDAKAQGLLLTEGYDFKDHDGCLVVGGELCGSHLGRTILHQGVFEDVVPLDVNESEPEDLTEVRPLQAELPAYDDLANELGETVARLMKRFDFTEETASKLAITAFLN